MKTTSTLMITALLTFLTGCTYVPAISAKKVTYDSSYPIGGTSVEIDDLIVTPESVKIGQYKRVSKWCWFGQTIKIESYSRSRSANESATIKTP